MINFIFMLTHHDRTVPHAEQVLAEVAGAGLAFVGCKDVGASPQRLRDLVARAHGAGLEMMLEVVSTSRDDELASVRAAADAGFDWVLGGTHAPPAAALLTGTGIRYCPFPGKIVGHPSVLEGEIDQIARSAAELTALDGVHGVDLLTYRHPSADAHALTAAVVAASTGPVIAAGSVVDEAQIATLAAAGAWGFTIGGAIFEGKLPGAPDVAAQVRHVLAVAAGAEWSP